MVSVGFRLTMLPAALRSLTIFQPSRSATYAVMVLIVPWLLLHSHSPVIRLAVKVMGVVSVICNPFGVMVSVELWPTM